MLDLMRGARPDERFHRQDAQPVPRQQIWGLIRKTTWDHLMNPDGSVGTFTSWWIGKLQYYSGSTKCDGTRTRMMNSGQLGDPTPGYVMTTTPKELLAFRWRANGPGEATWDNMGSS